LGSISVMIPMIWQKLSSFLTHFVMLFSYSEGSGGLSKDLSS